MFRPGRSLDVARDVSMFDIVYVLLGLAFFGATVGYTLICERL